MSSATEKNKPLKIVKPDSATLAEYLVEIWTFRHLIHVFVKQELKVQFAQTRLSILWLVVRPLIILGIFSFVFDKLLTIPDLKYPYPIFAFIGILVWNNFSYMVNIGGSAIITSQSLIKKIYFPKLILVLAKIIHGLVELVVSLLLLLILILFMGYDVSPNIIFLPVFLLINILTGTTIAIWLNSLTIKNRDLNHLVPILVGFLIWLVPVFYPTTLIPSTYSFILYLNPVAASIQGCRWAILGDAAPSIMYLPAIFICFVMLYFGLKVFVRNESDLVDFI